MVEAGDAGNAPAWSEPGGAALQAIRLPPHSAAIEIRRAWRSGDAVTVLDPALPAAALEAAMSTLRPTHLVDASGRHELPRGRPVREGVAAVVATSGTTGEPRMVTLGRLALSAAARAVNDSLAVDPRRDRWLSCLPLHQIAGLSMVARGESNGTPITVHDRFDWRAVASAAGECSLVSLVPTTLARLLDADAPLGRFRAILLGGGPAPAGLLARARQAGANIVTTYGLTETCGGCVHDGHALDGVSIFLDPSGEILVQGPVLMDGYHRDPGATERAFTSDGSLRTGDLGRFGHDGRLEVTDRKKDIIVTGGTNVSPAAVEQVLARHPRVGELSVAGLPDEHWGERVVAFVVPADRARPPSLEELRRFGSEVMGPAALPQQVVIVPSIPRTASGKALRRRLKEQAQGAP